LKRASEEGNKKESDHFPKEEEKRSGGEAISLLRKFPSEKENE